MDPYQKELLKNKYPGITEYLKKNKSNKVIMLIK